MPVAPGLVKGIDNIEKHVFLCCQTLAQNKKNI